MDKQVFIKVNPEEQKIFMMLKKYRDELGLKTNMRVAGGWVRDKVLGKQSKDIDIALDNMKGEQFVTLLKQHAENKQQKISGFGVTKFNPEMSKHLQTATAKIDNHWIDFVNLRSQQYNQQSRIPIMKFGTPLQDAQRRDFTINSLFYNLQTQQVQDCTGKGLPDLQKKILRTPLQPLITFRDDPLRILRCLRFKSRLDFKIDQSIYEAIKNEQIKQALLKKVSKQRVGTQLGGLLKAKHFFSGLQDIKNYGLWNIVLEIPKQCQLYGKKQIIDQIPQLSYTYTKNMIKSLQQNTWVTQKQLISQQKVQQVVEKKLKSKKKLKIQYASDQLQLLILLSSMTYIYKKYQVKIGKTKSNLITYMVKDQLKYPGKYADFAMHFAETVDKLSQIKSMNNVYQIIRWLRFAQQKWELAIHFLHAHHQTSKQEPAFDLFKLREEIIKRNLMNCYLAEPPVDGTFLTKKGIKGPAIGKILQNAIIWRLIHQQKSNEQFQKEYQQNSQFFISDKTYK